MSMADLIGWDRLRHGGLLLDPPRLRRISEYVPAPLSAYVASELRRRASAVLDGTTAVSEFVGYVLETVCGFKPDSGTWQRGTQIGTEWGRTSITGESVKPRLLWRGSGGGILPVFFENEPRLGIGRGRKTASQVVQWLRAGAERLALLTNGRQWRLICAGLDFEAWCEWDIDLWFEEGALSAQVNVLRILLSPVLWTPPSADAHPPLLAAILDSRKGQAELSAVLGERVREAVELLVQAHGDALQEHCAKIDAAEIYRAAVRVVMRMVVVLFAESRELLPRENALYHGAYGLNGLLEDLEKVAARGGNRLARSWTGWPRVLALFRLVHQGSHHPELPVPAYGGELFAPGDPASPDGLSRILALFESAAFNRDILSDRDLLRMLERITRTRVKIRQGRSSTWVPSPVDFSDLSSEYIGILYEGLLDFELKTAPAGDPVIFLAVGNQPVLPLSRLEAMDDKALADLLEKMEDTSKSGDEEEAEEEPGEAEASSEEPAEADEESAEEAGEEEENEGDAAHQGDARHTTRTRAEAWARRAVEAGKLVRKPKGAMTPEKRLTHEDTVARKARQLVLRVLLPGEWYLVRWGGTRKGSGTFYTRPGLAVPTVHRTLRPLAYTPPAGTGGAPDFGAAPALWSPRTPEEILAIKACDPACGSGTFPVAALRFLTDALYASLFFHGRITAEGDRSVVRLLVGTHSPDEAPEVQLGEELLPGRPDEPLFEPRLKAILRRHVVERSIYGVDLDPLAVELCKLALWIETMDRSLPFSFLDHKVKCGNGLVGAWFDQFQHYPVMAWKNREGGDKGHANGVHFEKEARGKAIKVFVKDMLTPDLRRFLEGRTLFSEDLQTKAATVHTESLATLSRLHDMPVQEGAERARLYRDELLGSLPYLALKEAMDLWCACWFWPVDELDNAPLPTTLASPREETPGIARRIASKKRFFHWELEFPDVFRTVDSGFDAILGNPPWETLQPNSMEFFSNIDPLYRSYGKQEALYHQTQYFNREAIECQWLEYTAGFACDSNWMKFVASPFGDPGCSEINAERFSISRGNENETLHQRWRMGRGKSIGFTSLGHPYRHRGEGKAYTYKLFLEQAHALLRVGGRLGFIVPSGLYSDHGTGSLRKLFLDSCRWEWLFGFENREGIFAIHRSQKFSPIIIEKGGSTESIRTAFMRRKLEDWENAETFETSYTRAQVDRFSPRSKSILEIQSSRDLKILEKLYANSVLLGDDGSGGWGIKYAQGDFNMTTDSKLFPPRPKWEEEGYRPDEYSRWLKGNWRPIAELWGELHIDPARVVPLEPECETRLSSTEVIATERRLRCAQPPYDSLPIPRAHISAGIILSREADAWIREDQVEDIALPLYEGRMIGQFDFSQKGWVSGKGRGAVWRDIGWDEKRIEPQYLMRLDVWKKDALSNYLKGFKKLYGAAAGEEEERRLQDPIQFDSWWEARRRKVAFIDVTSATNARTMYATALAELPCGNSVPVLSNVVSDTLLPAVLNSFIYDAVARFRCGGIHLNWFVIEESALPFRYQNSMENIVPHSLSLSFSHQRLSEFWIYEQHDVSGNWKNKWALSSSARLRQRCMVDSVVCYLFGLESMDVSYLLAGCAYPRGSIIDSNPKGFWRIDKSEDPELRHPILTLIAFHDLETKIRECGGDREKGIETFLNQNGGEGWMLPETVRLADYGLGHDDRAMKHQPVASRLGPRSYDWQLAQTPEESWRECHLHARNLLGEPGYNRLIAEIEAEKRGEKISPLTSEAIPPKTESRQIKLF